MAVKVNLNAWLRSFWKDIECPVPQSFPDVQGGGEREARPEQVQHQLAAGQVIIMLLSDWRMEYSILSPDWSQRAGADPPDGALPLQQPAGHAPPRDRLPRQPVHTQSVRGNCQISDMF